MAATQGTAPVYFKQPLRWLRFYAHNKPHLFFSVLIGLSGPLILFVGTPLRRKYLYKDHEPLPQGYPVPPGPRNKDLKGFEDEE